MKNLYFLAAVAAFVLGSCTVEEALDPPAGPDDEAKAIEFDTFLDRAPQNGIKPLTYVTDISWLRIFSFQVEAYKHAETDWNSWNDGARTVTPNFMKAKPVKWNSSTSWTYSPIEYWPASNSNWDKVSFFAYIPTTGWSPITFTPAKAADVNENPKLYCVMPPGMTPGQVDLVVDARYNVRGNDDNGKVKFEFDHVLSRIGFQAKLKNDYAPATVTMSSLIFHYGDSRISGTYTFNSGTDNGDDKNNKAENSWKVDGGTKGTDSENVLASSGTLSSTKPLIPGNSRYLMLIPQKNEQAYVTVTYTITYPPGSGQSPETVSNKRVDLPPIVWKPGIAYTYTLIIAALKEMIFHVSEGDDWNGWKDGGDIPPINVQ
jgi:hypothetical protein